MARSRKKRPAGGITTAASEKADKTQAHRRTRRSAAAALARGDEPEPSIRQTENPWSYSKDGKQWYDDPRPGLLRK
jgi:hypothetical protein